MPLAEAYSFDSDQTSDAEALSPAGMQVDGDEYVVEPLEGEQDNVAIINPDDDAEQVAGLPTADDRMCSGSLRIRAVILNHYCR